MIHRPGRWLQRALMVLVYPLFALVTMGVLGWLGRAVAEAAPPAIADPNVVTAGCTAVLAVAVMGRLLIALPRAWCPIPDVEVSRAGVRIPVHARDRTVRVPWAEIAGVGIGTPPSQLPGQATTVVVVALRPRSTAQHEEFAAELDLTRALAERARSLCRTAIADEIETGARVLERWQRDWSSRPQPLGMAVVLDAGRLDAARLDAAVRAWGPGPVVHLGPLTDDALDSPHESLRRLDSDVWYAATADT